MRRSLYIIILTLAIAAAAFGQGGPVAGTDAPRTVEYVSQEISEDDGLPVILKHLPNWQAVASTALVTNDPRDLSAKIGPRPLFSELEFLPGTEAVLAAYPEGNLLLIEYATPQAAAAADERYRQFLLREPQGTVVYRRIGNYTAFVLDTSDTAAATSLLDAIKYEKTVQWLGEDPFLLQKLDRYFASTGRDVALSTVLFIFIVLVTAIVLGIVTGFAYFKFRENKRASMTAFSDAGGMTRLNLDELAEPLQLKS